ncbi:hypothetical protein Anas_06207 [Armadillidium nasatum]|uniref:Uncharacterized protein n=1 Tax=Armadillidium nasatum TaxID=96803 RepID=A0A5N5TFF7_9CRUS|nr:hypothetical protein Anas_06207 [Armadillidium nasatum]
MFLFEYLPFMMEQTSRQNILATFGLMKKIHLY